MTNPATDRAATGQVSPAGADAVLAALPIPVFVTDRAGRCLAANPAAAATLGSTVEAMLGRTWADLGVPPDLLDRIDRDRERVFATGSPVTTRADVRAPSPLHEIGWRVWDYTLTPIVAPDGAVWAVLATATDVTDGAQAARTADRVARLHQLTTALGDVLTAREVAAVLLHQAAEAFGADAGNIYLLDRETLRLTDVQGYAEGTLDAYERLSLDAGIPNTDAVVRGEAIYLADAADWAAYPAIHAIHAGAGQVSAIALPLLFQGRALGALGLSFREQRAFDPEEREFAGALGRAGAGALERARLYEVERAARAAAERERARLDALFRQAPAGFVVLRGPDLVFTLANPQYERMVGRHDLVGKPIREVLPEVAGQGYFELLDRVYATGERHVGQEARVRFDQAGDGTLQDAYFNFVYEPLRDGEGRVDGIFVHAVDVTDLVRARAEAAAERDRLQQVLDVLPEAVLIADAATRTFALSNRACEAVLGVDLRGLPVPFGPEPGYGSRHFDGTPIAADDLPLQRALQSGESITGAHYQSLNAATGQEVPVLVNSAPLRDPAGAITGGVVVFQDTTALRELDRQKDEFLATVSHDLQQPLTAIKGRAFLLKRAVGRGQADAERLTSGLEAIDTSVEHMRAELSGLLDALRVQMGRPLELHREPVDLVPLVRAAVDEVVAATETHSLGFTTDLPALVLAADPVRLRRVFDNLLSNAVKFSPAGSEVQVRLRQEGRADGARAVVEVADQGVGIPAEDLPHLFERFHRGSNVTGRTDGTGLGLVSVRRIVEQHGGEVRIESEEGRGTTVGVSLPVSR